MSIGVFGMNETYTIGAQITTLTDGEYVAWGTSATNLASSVSNDWVYCTSTKANWIVFQVVKINNLFYLKNTSNNKYIYSSGPKKVTLDSSNKTSITLTSVVGKGHIVDAGSTIGKYTFNSTGIRPYTSNTYNAANLYKVNIVSYTITAESNNTSYGTVSLSGNVITGSPKNGYRYASPAYSVSPDNSTTVVQNGNEFIVTPSANTTVTINFEPIPTYTVRFINSGVVYDERPNIKEDSTITDFPTGIEPNDACKKNGWEFVGWTETENGTTTVDELTVKKNDTLYAIYKLTDVGTSYVTDTLTKETFAPYDGTSYKSYENITTPSGSIYAGNSAGGEGALQLRSGTSKGSTIHSGIFNTRSIGLIDCIRLKWNTTIKDQYGTEKNSGKVIKFYISEVPFSSANDMYSGIHIEDSFPNGTSVIRIAPTPYIGIRPKEGAIYFDSIFITWKVAGSELLYSTNPKCYDAGVSVVHWYKDSIKFGIDEIGASTDVILYATNDTISEYTHIPDSSYKFAIQDIDTLKCTYLKFITTKSNGDECIRRFSIPIMIDNVTSTLCDSCDVAILSNGQLNIENDTVSGDIIIYEGGLLNVKSGNTYSVNSLTLRRDNDSVPCLSYKGTLDISNGLFFEIRSDGSDWRWVVLPDTFNIREISANVYKNGVWSDALVKHYDGTVRANNGSGGWKLTPVNTVFNPGAGFIFGAYMVSETEKRIYRISLDTAILKLESKDKGVNVYPYGKGLKKPANDLGWNVVGNPFMDSCNISSSNPIRIGELVKTGTNPWDGKWIVDSMSPEKKLNYIVVKDYHDEYADAGYYKSIPLKVDGYSLEPFTSFFIQVDTALTNPTLLFTKSIGISKSPSRINEENEEVFLRINVGNKKTGCFVSNKYNDNYEIGYDLESNENIYQSINGYKLLYSAINDSILSSGIKVYTAGGTLSLCEKTDTHRFSEIKALYNDELYDLLNGETVEVNGEFILFGARRHNEVATGFEENYKNLTTHKVIVNGILYIIVNDKAYNVLGKRVR